MKVIFMGTPDFAVPCLEMLINEGYEVPLVVTQPDRQRGRGHKVSFSPVKEYALLNEERQEILKNIKESGSVYGNGSKYENCSNDSRKTY